MAMNDNGADEMPAGQGGKVDENLSLEPGLISLVLATYNRSAELAPMLESLLSQSNQNFELIVVDQNKDDRIVPLLDPVRDAGIAVRHLRQEQPNLSAARNMGLSQARGEFVAFPDDDCWYEVPVLEHVRESFNDGRGVDGVIGRWVELDPEASRPAEDVSLEAWRRFKGGDATSFVLFFRTGAVRDLGGFNETFGTGRWFGCGEETDLVMRLLDDGMQITYRPDVHIHHFHAPTQELSAGQCRRNRSYGRGTGAVLAKHKLPLWVIGRGLVGPLYHAVRSPRPASALVLEACTILGRVEGLAGWYLWGAGAQKDGAGNGGSGTRSPNRSSTGPTTANG